MQYLSKLKLSTDVGMSDPYNISKEDDLDLLGDDVEVFSGSQADLEGPADNLLYPQTKVGDILDSGPSRRRRRRNFLVDAITQKQINIFFSNLVHMLRVPKGRSLF